MFKVISLYFHTLKNLKFLQIYHRILKRLIRPKVNFLVGEQSVPIGRWVEHELYPQKLFNKTDVEFLNHRGKVNSSTDWNNDQKEKLWLYNLHYFDDLNSFGSSSRRDLQSYWILKWIDENPAALSNGWEPYPTSLRIVNWIKAFMSGLTFDQVMLNSLAKQADFLSQNIEHHILGNHLFTNAKALIFAGTYLKGKAADDWLEAGLNIYAKELDEQLLHDGGNFELTPMYHVIMLVDLLDLINLWTAYPNKVDLTVIEKARHLATKMLDWLKTMSHIDGEISFFNDSAFGIAPENEIVYGYATKLGLQNLTLNFVNLKNLMLFNLDDSGYVVTKSKEYSLIADLASVGPRYQPGHAHADTLSYEFSLGIQRVFVNSGISEYSLSEERLRQRETSAHNTVVVNGLSSSQVWSGFRVAKRASILNKIVDHVSDNSVSFSAAHNGFTKQGVNCVHHRNWFAENDSVTITDRLIGDYINAESYLHLHPEIEVLRFSDEEIILNSGDSHICIKISGAKVLVENTTWHPEFGVKIANKKLCFLFEKRTMKIAITWKNK